MYFVHSYMQTYARIGIVGLWGFQWCIGIIGSIQRWSGGSGPRENPQDMIKYNMTENTFLDEFVPASPVGTMEPGTMTFLPTSGALMIFRGRTDGYAVRNIMGICAYDISTRIWCQICSINASVRDRISHSIFIYGGRAFEEAKSLKDVVVLSLPSFLWINIGCEESITYRGRGICRGRSDIRLKSLSLITKYEVKCTVKMVNEPAYHISRTVIPKGFHILLITLETHE
ncbi:hypothetical protein BGX38DRAFT_1262003 [Terfezia claveryi]|nr:hypothetical protein BGX38DRAFT_1262003 [Terfezia claveryi]